ncbi:MAG: helix-turn-helix transcriptional regulator [Bacteroidetes bacterium]|nr:helix-turn-helix transcriptional regulator [Bacteroidota bacterium]
MKKALHKQWRKAFGLKLREIRKSKDLTQATLAYMADIELSTLNRIELGKAGTSLTNIFALCEALSIHPKELFEFPL